MKSTNTYIKGLIAALLTGIFCLTCHLPSIAQGCNQVEINYDEPACFKEKSPGGAGPSNNRDCIPVGVCEKQLYTYSAAGGPWASYLWTITGPASPAINPSATAPTVTITWPLQGTYILTLTVTDAGGNTFKKCLEVTVKEKPVANFTFAPVTGCAPLGVNFTNTTTFSGTAFYSWNFGDPSSGASNFSNLTDPSHVYNTPGTYTVTLVAFSSIIVPGGGGTAGGGHGDSISVVTCCPDTIKKTITVQAGTVKIECISTVCAGAVSKYTAVGCVSPTWGTPVGGTTISTSGNTITVQWGNGNPQGQLSVTCGGGCTAYATIPIVPTAPVIVGNGVPCTTGPSSYSVPYLPGTYYTWTLTNVTTSTPANSLLSTYPDNNVVLVDWSLAVPGNTYQLTINLNNKHLCCNSTGTLIITPKGRFSIIGPNSICRSQSAGFFPIPGGTFNWATSPVTGVTPPSLPSASTYTATFATAGSFIITATNTSGAFCNTSASASLNVVPVPVPGTIVGPTTGCAGNQYVYYMSTPAPAGYYYDWTITPSGTFEPGGLSGTTGDTVTVNWSSLPGTITVFLRQSNAPNCSVPAGTLTMTSATPGAVSGTTSVCVDGNGVYTITGGTLPSGTTITWSISPSSLGTIISGQGTNSITVLWHGQTGSGPWGPATINASTGCGNATALGGIMIYPKFAMTIATTGLDVCQTGGMSLTANGAPGGATYSWSPGGASTQTITGITTPGTYVVTATAGGCSAMAQIQIPDPFQIIPVACGVGFCNNLNTNEQLGIQVIKPLSGTFTYEWHSGTCTSPGPILQTTTTTALSNNFMAPLDGNYCVIVRYGNCQKCLNFVVKKVCCPDVNNPSITNTTQLSCDQYSFTGTTPNPNNATITWDFGDGTNAPGVSGVPITHTYANAGIYCVTFCVGPPSSNPTNCTGNCAVTTAVVPISAAFTYTMSCGGCLVVNNLSSVFVNPSLVTWLWDFGDATTSTLQFPPQHCYTSPGTYVVKLTVTYNGAVTCTKTTQQTVVYTPLAINAVLACSGSPVMFSSTPTGFVSYSWAFGDGFTGFVSPISHTYTTAGSYTASLTVTDALGNNCTVTKNLSIAQGITSCTILPAFLCPGSSATLNGPAGTYSYLWQVQTGPGTFVNAPGPNTGSTYTTTVPGSYHVIVTDGSGCTCVSNTVAVTAVAKPKASFSISPSKNLCGPGLVSFAAPFVNGYTYAWFTNGAYGTPVGSGPNYLAFMSTTTTVNLIVTNQYGCKDTCSQIVTVNTPPTPPAIATTGLCEGVPITLIVTNYTNNITWNNGATTISIVVYTAGTYVATYTDPATGCSSSSKITINRRPSAGLFPHLCDSIPCKCTRPFVIYPPNPLIGLFASNYTYDWYNGNTNAFLFTGTPFDNGGLGVQTGSYYVVITDQSTGCKDTSQKYSVLVPLCDTCDCRQSQWGEMVLTPVGGGNPISLKCDKTYTLTCNKPYSLSAFFNCKDTICKGKVTYKLQPPLGPAITGTAPVNFTPTISGTYVLTLYGYCGNKPCDSCVIKFNVKCSCYCDGSKWGDITLAQVTPTGAGPTQTLKCKNTYTLDCNKTFTVNTSYICKDTGCKGKVTYSLQPPVGAAITGAIPLTFTATLSGTYVLTLYGWCGDFICDSCIIKFTVICGCDCKDSKWGSIVMTSGTPPDLTTQQTLKCSQSYKLDCFKTYNISTSYFCKDSTCNGKVTYSLLPPGGPAVTGSSPLSFTPSLTGTYVLTLYGWCGDKICDSCVIKFDVNCDCDCKGSKWLEKTLSNGTTTTTLACKDYEWKCNTPFTINGIYSCSPTFCNGNTTYKLIPAFGVPVTGTLPLTYTPILSGLYTVVIYGSCGNKICDSCVARFKVDCPKDTTCCKYDIGVVPGTVTYAATTSGTATIASQTFTITGLGTAPLTEVRAEVLSYDISSNFSNECLACKSLPYLWASINSTTNIGTVPPKITLYGGATTPVFNPTGTAVYQNPREVIWNNGSIFSITSPIGIKFFLPPPPLIDCCELRGRICVKFTFRDRDCRECEVITCFDVVIKK